MEYLLNDVEFALVRTLLEEHIQNCKDCPISSFPIEVALKSRNLPCGVHECITAYHRRLLRNMNDLFNKK